MIILYLLGGLVFHNAVISNYTVKKRSVPMWAVHSQLIVGWLPMLIYSICNQESELEMRLNQSVKDAGLIHSRDEMVLEMPGKEDFERWENEEKAKQKMIAKK